VCELARRHRVEMPISAQVHAVIRREVSPRDAVQLLLARERKAEGRG
jgi:glycerol-3-phosphate dehydrogenase